MENQTSILDIWVYPLCSAIGLYTLARVLTIVSHNGKITLNKPWKRILLPFSRQNHVSPVFISTVCCCYVVIMLFALSFLLPVEHRIDVYDFNILCTSLYAMAISAPMVFYTLSEMKSTNLLGKIEYFISCLVFIAFTVIGAVNTIHVFLQFVKALI